MGYLSSYLATPGRDVLSLHGIEGQEIFPPLAFDIAAPSV